MKKVALITGGTSGLGLQLVSNLSKNGYKVYSLSRDIDKIKQIKSEYPEVTFLCGDVSSDKIMDSVFNEIETESGKLNVLVNNAGIIYPGGVEDLSIEKWNDMFAVNVHGIFIATKKMLPLLKMEQNSNVVNISSISSKMTGSSIAYSACKASVDMITKSMAKEFSKYGIRVNSVNPGIISTGFQVHNNLIEKQDYQQFLSNVSETYPLGIGDANDVAKLVEFIISEDAKWITGSNYIIDGGRSVNI